MPPGAQLLQRRLRRTPPISSRLPVLLPHAWARGAVALVSLDSPAQQPRVTMYERRPIEDEPAWMPRRQRDRVWKRKRRIVERPWPSGCGKFTSDDTEQPGLVRVSED